MFIGLQLPNDLVVIGVCFVAEGWSPSNTIIATAFELVSANSSPMRCMARNDGAAERSIATAFSFSTCSSEGTLTLKITAIANQPRMIGTASRRISRAIQDGRWVTGNGSVTGSLT